MIVIEKTCLDFDMENEFFACELYGRWDEFSRVAVEGVVDEVLSRYDTPDEVIRLESLSLDLGSLPEDEFYERFPRLLADRLEEAFADCLRHKESRLVKVIPVRENRMEALLYYLLHGVLPESASQEYRDMSELLKRVMKESGNHFVTLLRQTGNSILVRERLALQFANEELGWVVEAAEPEGADFVTVYVRYLIVSHQWLERPEVTARDYRNVVWQIVLAYLLFDGRSYFSRREMVWQTVRGVAARFNLETSYLLQLLVSGLGKFTEGWIYVPELLMIFSDIRKGVVKETMEIGTLVARVGSGGQASGDDKAALRRLLAGSDTCRRILAPLKEKEIIRLVELIVPAGSAFLAAYAEKLDKEKERGMLEGRAGSEFRILKWEFMFLVLLEFPESSFQRKRFVWSVICRIAAHYNLEALALLAFLYVDSGDWSEGLAGTLKELYQEQVGETEEQLDESSRSPGHLEDRYAKLVYVLSHPLLVRQFLTEVPEERIYRLVEKIIPAERIFIVAYAGALDKQKERGMMEGKAGSEFRVLKWEFIFMVILSAPASSFQRKQFVHSILRQIAAHYNLAVIQLLDYFYGIAGKGMEGLPSELMDIISVLWSEEKIIEQGRKNQETDERHFVEMLVVLSGRKAISIEEWRTVGFHFSLSLLARCDRSDVVAFMRKHKEGIWQTLFQSREEARVLFDRLCKTKGMLAFMMAEYGRATLTEAFEKAGIGMRTLVECGLSDWKEWCEKGDTATLLWWLKNSPETVARIWRECPETEESPLLEKMAGEKEIQQEWIWKNGSGALRQAMERLQELQKSFISFPGTKTWYAWLTPYTRKRYANLSFRDILSFFWKDLVAYLPPNERKGMERMILEEEVTGLTDFKQMIMEKQNTSELQSRVGHEPDGNLWKNTGKEEPSARFFIENAGLVLLAVYFPQLFSVLKCTEQGKFASEESQVKAVFLLQRLLYDQDEFGEPDLILNKLLVGYDLEQPLPRHVEISGDECKVLNSMIEGAKSNWNKMGNTSLEGFRQSFLIRNGIMEDTGDFWQLAVEERGYDMLLASLPWSYSPVKLPWMNKPIYVKWKN